MATNDQLSDTTRYLRFALAPDHRAPVQDGSACPHCRTKHVQKWGRFSGRQRYRCTDCGRTFSTFTGTALHHLKRPDLWRRFLWCIDGRLTVRSSAAVLGVDKDTALRWRHRLLAQWRNESRPRLNGRIVVGHFSIPHSDKGGRYLQRPPRQRGEPWFLPGFQTGPVTVLVALEDLVPAQAPVAPKSGTGNIPAPTQGSLPAAVPAATPVSSPVANPVDSPAMLIEHVGVRRLRSADYDRRIPPRMGDVTEIVGCKGPLSPLARFAGRVGADYTVERRSFFPHRVFLVRRELRGWLRPFRGVATRRLDNYLEWFRRRRGRGADRGPPTTPADRAGWAPT